MTKPESVNIDDLDVNELAALLYAENPDIDNWGDHAHDFAEADKAVTAHAQAARRQALAVLAMLRRKSGD